jgi:hypothetical protein
MDTILFYKIGKVCSSIDMESLAAGRPCSILHAYAHIPGPVHRQPLLLITCAVLRAVRGRCPNRCRFAGLEDDMQRCGPLPSGERHTICLLPYFVRNCNDQLRVLAPGI